MGIIAIDTALHACSVAITCDGVALASITKPMARGQAEAIAPMVHGALAEAELVPNALTAIVVTRGPGAFTGLRCGLAFARSMALALDVPCIGVDTLTALRVSVDPDQNQRVVAGIAVAGSLFLAAWEGTAVLCLPERVSDPVTWFGALSAEGEGWILTGPAAGLLNEHWPAAHVSAADWPDPVALAQLALGLNPEAHPPEPLYLRGADARLPGGLVAADG
jgi:tRNA threonylcarbamoyladenosine biosynthesis protein TsaB